MNNYKSEFFKTKEVLKSDVKEEKESSVLLFDKEKVLGTPVKVLRTGKDEPEDGWHITKIYIRTFQKGEEKIDQAMVKVRKQDKEKSDVILEKGLSLQVLEKINPEIKFLVFEKDVDYLLYKDDNFVLKVGQIVDINFQEESFIVCLSQEDDESSTRTEKVNMSNLLDKSKDLEKLRQFMYNTNKQTRYDKHSAKDHRQFDDNIMPPDE